MTLFVFRQSRSLIALGLVIAALFSLNACSSRQAPQVSSADGEGPHADPSETGAALAEAELPAFEVVQHKDVSYDFGPVDSAQRLVLRVEIPEWPVTKEQLEALAGHLIETERGNGWQAISIAMGADRDESVPAYGMFEWAPGGDWSRASEGDADTWAGYEFSIEWGKKMLNPEEAACVKPPPIQQGAMGGRDVQK
jgi:hypothetical protein